VQPPSGSFVASKADVGRRVMSYRPRGEKPPFALKWRKNSRRLPGQIQTVAV